MELLTKRTKNKLQKIVDIDFEIGSSPSYILKTATDKYYYIVELYYKNEPCVVSRSIGLWYFSSKYQPYKKLKVNKRYTLKELGIKEI